MPLVTVGSRVSADSGVFAWWNRASVFTHFMLEFYVTDFQ